MRFERRKGWVCVLLATLCAAVGMRAQGLQAGGQTLPETLEAIEKARVTTRILYVTAHPDDEPGPVLAYLARGLHAEVALFSLTRGEGGQNALGPEYGPRLAILRTEELLAATGQYGTRLYFTRAPDFGYSKSPEETMRIWGDAVLADMVRVIRIFRPHIIINSWGGVHTGHGQHQASGLLTPQAFEAAADPKRFPEQLGNESLPRLRPWKARRLVNLGRTGDSSKDPAENPDFLPLPVAETSSLWGMTWAEIGAEGYANHHSQGVEGVRTSPYVRRLRFLVAAEGARLRRRELAGNLTALPGIFPWFAAQRAALEKVDSNLVSARDAAGRQDWAATAESLARAAVEMEGVLRDTNGLSAADAEDARYELQNTKEKIDEALVAAMGLRLEAQADRREVVRGEGLSVDVRWSLRGALPVRNIRAELLLPFGWGSVHEEKAEAGKRFTVDVPEDAKELTGPSSHVYPGKSPPVWAKLTFVVGNDGYEMSWAVPARATRVTTTTSETTEMELVPAVTLTPEPRQFVVLEKRPPKQLELVARVHHYGASATEITAGVAAPAGWTVSAPVALKFSGAGDQLVRFTVTPPTRLAAGNYQLKPYAQRGAERFDTSLEPLPTLPKRLYAEPAVTSVRVFDATAPAGLTVGYVAAENDPIPDALRQIGVKVELLDEVALAFSDLSRFDAIAIGIRAYELRGDLARANQRLLDYTAAGGTLVVQYQRPGVWNTLKPAPYLAAVSNARVSVEDSPVRIPDPAHPVLNFPNPIRPEDYAGWVQERGLYFWGKFDSRYQGVLGMHDPGEEESLGGLVYARHGKGVYLYTGLSFFRQLPAGVPGAYRLFLNLLSQSKAPQQ